MKTQKVNESTWNIIKDGEAIGYIERKMKPSAFGGAWIQKVYVGGVRKEGLLTIHPDRATERHLKRFL